MNSCLYECRVMHHRTAPKEHRFSYRIFMFCLDPDELELWHRKLRFFSHNRRNIYAFRDDDHLISSPLSLKEKLMNFLREQGQTDLVARVLLVTLPRVFGYIFNPVSLYFCFDEKGAALCAVAEVGNTFREIKSYLLTEKMADSSDIFTLTITKFFYVSPFFDHDLQFVFQLAVPGENLVAQIDDYNGAQRVLHTTLTGRRRPLTDAQLAWFTLKYPFITLQVIGGIHWEALKLWWKGLPYHRKSAHPHLQRDRQRPGSPAPVSEIR